MTWTSLDVRRQRFKRRWRGYDPEEVHLFLNMVAEELERLTGLLRKMEQENADLQDQLRDFREKERHIRNTLVAVQQTRDRIKADAEREAELIIKEAELQRDRILDGARRELERIYQEIEQLRLERQRLHNQFLAELKAVLQWIEERQQQEAATGRVQILSKQEPKSRRG